MGILGRLWSDKGKVPALDVRIAAFREILHANNTALGFITRIQEGRDGRAPVRTAEVRHLATGAAVQTYRMIANLNRLTGDRHRALFDIFARIRSVLAHKVDLEPALQSPGFVLPLDAVGPPLSEAVGQKSAYLGEARRILGDCVPTGFAITADAYRAFMATDGLGERVTRELATIQPDDVTSAYGAAARLTAMIETARLPEELTRAIEQSVSDLAQGKFLRLAVRSSALDEGGGELSFAGQYRSLLNVWPAGVVHAYRRVVASKYSPQAIAYRNAQGISDSPLAMCCCVLGMVDASAAGVLYTAFPTDAGLRTLLQAVRGLGVTAVDGSAEPDSFTLDRKRRRVLTTKRGLQASLLKSAPAEGTVRERLSEAALAAPAIRGAEALAVAELGWRLEDALGMPVDVEWAIDRSGRPFVLQVRPLSDLPLAPADRRPALIPNVPVLIERGTRASGGAGSGPVTRITTGTEPLHCLPGAVVVSHDADPRLAVLLPQVSALVTDLGEVTGHLATVARELRVPALFATRTATEILTEQTIVTVDADVGVVYQGRVAAALGRAARPSAGRPCEPGRALLNSISPLIVPLTLRDRLSSGCSPRKCRTLHDLVRFCHQATVEAMFELGDSALRGREPLKRLVSSVPIDCRLFDLGGGIRPGVEQVDVTVDDVVCRPLRHLWRGMTDPRVQWRQQRPVSLRGFMSALVNYNFDDDARLRAMGEPSYVFLSADYLNLNSRIGYHFSTVDSRITDTVESNYASFRFAGGSTGIDQRSRRATLIQRLLGARGFETDCRADLVNSRIRHRHADEMDELLRFIGLVMAYVNHLDMALTSNETMARYEQAFLAGDYGFKGTANF